MSNTEKQVVTRIAPSPTGEMHIGNLRSAIYSYIFAKQNNGKFILRIEDTDRERSNIKAIKDIDDTLSLFNMKPDERYIQSDRKHIYAYYAHNLIDKGLAYICTCPKESIEECHCNNKTNFEQRINNSISYCIKLNVKVHSVFGHINCFDAIRNDYIKFDRALLNDIVLLKSDGYPTYHLASVVDDHLMGVTDVFRGDEWISSFPIHVLLYQAFNWQMPNFYHLPLILNSEGNKLSKRDGDFSVKHLVYGESLLPLSIINYVALLGWHPSGNQEVFNVDDLISYFDVKRLNKSAAMFDFKKLRKLNLIHSKTPEGICNYYQSFNSKLGSIMAERYLKIFQAGINIIELINKITYCTTQPKLIFPIADLNFLTDIYNYIFIETDIGTKSRMIEYDDLLSQEDIDNIMYHLTSLGYGKKMIHETLRYIFTDDKEGIPGDWLLSILYISDIKSVCKYYGNIK